MARVPPDKPDQDARPNKVSHEGRPSSGVEVEESTGAEASIETAYDRILQLIEVGKWKGVYLLL